MFYFEVKIILSIDNNGQTSLLLPFSREEQLCSSKLEIIKTNVLRAPKIIKIHYVVTACPCYFWCAFGL
jgi:hypothetical protein